MRIPFRRRIDVDEAPTLGRSTLSDAVESFWENLSGSAYSPRLLSRVWVANRCIQLNTQQIAAMPLRFMGGRQPAWVTNPDPVWYPNGVSDAVFAAVWSMYGWGDAFLYVTSRYADGLPAGWTVLDPYPVTVELRSGRRVYKSQGRPLNPDDVVQISRNPNGGLRGTSALASYAPLLWGSLSSGELSRTLMGENPVPHAVLKSQRKLTDAQASALQAQWVERTAARSGAPAVLPPELDFEQLAFSPRDLLLLDAQEFNARVIASAFNVPAFMLNLPMSGGLTYQNPEILFDFWWRAELRPAAKRISDALTAQMLPRGSSVTFDAREVLAPSLAELNDIWLSALAAGAVTPDEYRRAVLQIGPLDEDGAIDELLQPASAGASPADQAIAADVVALRPNTMVVS